MLKDGTIVIYAVHERDAEKFWERLELGGKEKCHICGDETTWRGFGAVAPLEGKVVIACQKPTCMIKLNIEVRNKRSESNG